MSAQIYKVFLAICCISISVCAWSAVFVPNSALAKIIDKGFIPKNVQVNASVGEFKLNLCGWMSPYASIVLKTQGIFIGATVADKGGNWEFNDILIRRGFSQACFTAIDFHRLGQSDTCITIPPAQADVTICDIFLPPTLGLSQNEVPAGGKVLAFGYTMPGAKVTLHLSDGRVLTTVADASGYYVFSLDNIPAGKYQLFATANYKAKESLKPSKTVELLALSWWDSFLAFLARLWAYLVGLFTSLGLGPLWIGLPLLLLITFLILKLWPEKFTFIYESKLIAWLPKKEKKLHHFWMEGVGY